MSLIRLSLNCCCFTTWFILLSVTKKSLPLTGPPFYANGPSERKEMKSNHFFDLYDRPGIKCKWRKDGKRSNYRR